MQTPGTAGSSPLAKYFIGRLLSWMESDRRRAFNDPQSIVGLSGIAAGQRVLEIGCGSGFFTPALSALVGPEGWVDSIDLHPLAVEATTRKARECGLANVRVTRADAHQTGLPEASFDAAVLYGVVPAPVISQPRLALEIHRILRPGGILAIWTAVPFWTPRVFVKTAGFTRVGAGKVHRLQKSSVAATRMEC